MTHERQADGAAWKMSFAQAARFVGFKEGLKAMRSVLIGALCAAMLPLSATAQEAVSTQNGTVRILDKSSGVLTDLTLSRGEAGQVGLLSVMLDDCRYPAGNAQGDAWAALEIRYEGIEGPVFSGWMVASAPALNALDHPRYDVWVLRCET